MRKKTIFILIAVVSALPVLAQQWPTPTIESKPGARWWWLGSAVDKENLQWNMRQYANHGIGALEITPIYGVQGNEANNIPYLSDKWMEMLRYVEEQGKENDIEISMATGTGWPFGGPWVPIEEAACKVVFVQKDFTGKKVKDLDLSVDEKEKKYAQLGKVMAFTKTISGERRCFDVTTSVVNGKLTWKAPKVKKGTNEWQVIAQYVSRTRQKVKRAAPGGEGWVIDHFDKNAVKHYLEHFDKAFARTGVAFPHTFFNDSYEVYGANWTPTLLDEFAKRRGYRLEENFDLLLDGDKKTVSDYRETIADLVLENFTEQWTEWAHSHGAITRNQAHGTPGNLIDCYAAVDIPEIEGFGLSEFGIKGLRTDTGKTKKNFSDLSMLKYAPSAAHIMGKKYTSSETFTWLTEHFRTSLSQLKPDMDLMFCAGVNHMFFHGTAYSPKDDEWPGWKFYASIDMSPTNSIWRDAPYFMQYVERCQSFLQWGKPDNDFLVYLPVRDMWQNDTKNLLMQFDIHSMAKKAPAFIKAILQIDSLGYDCDYISEKYLLTTNYVNGMLQTSAGTRYKGLIIPGDNIMTDKLKTHIDQLKAQGANIVYGIDGKQMAMTARAEMMKTRYGLKMIRRSNEKGYHYFIANLTPNDINEDVRLGVDFADALWFNPMNGERYHAEVDNGKVHIDLRSGESIILETFNQPIGDVQGLSERKNKPFENKGKLLTKGWYLDFKESVPSIEKRYDIDELKTWENLDENTAKLMGTGVYTANLKLTKKDLEGCNDWMIDLGDVRESARVYINGNFIGCAWAVPYLLRFSNLFHEGVNTIKIEVTNLPANRIADLDRKGVAWRKMNEINVVDINYQKTTYENWAPMPSGLNSRVILYRVK
ncbi:MAG: glycosyl hydrolase family 2 [Prevotella sp.]|nr:glycosyl hydrolase family 2 [Prevotella sp.]